MSAADSKPPAKGEKTKGRTAKEKGRKPRWYLDDPAPANYSSAPRVPYPPTSTPVTPAATPRERAVVAKYIDFRNRMRNGPLYTVLGTNVRVKKRYSAATTIGINPFHRTTYSHRYRRTDRTAPDLSNLAWMTKFLPEELWSAVDPSVPDPETVPTKKKKRGKVRLNLDEITEDDPQPEEEEEEEEDIPRSDLDSDEEVEPKPRDDDLDETWEDDEDSDMDYQSRGKDDYNAEQYFDNGEEFDLAGGGDDYDGGDWE